MRLIWKSFFTAILAAAVSLPLALLIGWKGAFQIGNCLFMVGGLLVGAGVFSIFGNWGAARSWRYQQAESAGAEDIRGRMMQAMKDAEASYSFALVTGMAGLTLIAASIILQAAG